MQPNLDQQNTSNSETPPGDNNVTPEAQPQVSPEPIDNASPQQQPATSDSPQAVTTNQPESTQPLANPEAVHNAGLVSSHQPKNRKPLLIGIIILVAIIALGAAYFFFIYWPSTPANMYKSGLQNSAKAIDKFTENAHSQEKANLQSAVFDAKMNIKSTSISAEGSLTGKFDKQGNGNAKLDVNVMGQKLSADLISIKTTSSQNPDLYIKASNIKDLLNQNGMAELSSLDGQWIKIDHTIVDTAMAKSGQNSKTTKSPTEDQLVDAMRKMNAVNNKYLFTADPQTAILTNNEFLGKETKDGRSMYHYRVGYNKDHLQSYVKDMAAALDSSKLNDWFKSLDSGDNISKSFDVEGLVKDIKEMKSDSKFELWIDAKTKLVSIVKFDIKQNNKPTSTVTLSQKYTGGSEFPLALSINGDIDGRKANIDLNLTTNTSTNKSSLVMNYNEGDSQSAKLSLNITPSNDSVKESAPAKSKPINDVLNSLF